MVYSIKHPPLISIIVPVYKVELYLKRCLESILMQSYSNWECILIDDGSPDHSGQICDEYNLIDSRFRVFHVENGGVSRARNIGIRNARGKFVTFIDSDDFIDLNFIEELSLPCLADENIDFVQAGCVNYFANGIISPNQKYEKYIGDDKAIIFKNFRGLVFSKLFNLDKINRYAIVFDTSMKYGEDMVFTIDYLIHSVKYALVDTIGYYYVQREGSAMNSTIIYNYDRDYHSFLHRYNSVNNYINKFKITEKDAELRYKQTSDSFYTALFSLYNSNFSYSQIYERYKKDIKSDYLKLSKYSSTLISKSIMRGFNYGGFFLGDCCVRILKFIFHLKKRFLKMYGTFKH